MISSVKGQLKVKRCPKVKVIYTLGSKLNLPRSFMIPGQLRSYIGQGEGHFTLRGQASFLYKSYWVLLRSKPKAKVKVMMPLGLRFS